MRSFFLFLKMQSFLEEVVQEVLLKQDSLEDIVFILPSKRAGTFLKNCIAKTSQKTQFAPDILSVENFVENVADLAYANSIEQLFTLYAVYLDWNTEQKEEKDSFPAFTLWGQTLLQDFNEIDRYLVDQKKIFSYLSDIQELNHWYLTPQKTKMMTDYIRFWNNLEQLYTEFNHRLLCRGLGSQGLVYREAARKIKAYIQSMPQKKHIFIGFNALNTAESVIIQELLTTTNAEIYWDTDSYFINDPIHDAGLFIRQYLKDWPILKGKKLKPSASNYLTPKKIQITGVPKNVSQAKYVSSLLNKIALENTTTLSKTAIVLGDETLLNPLLHSVPKEIEGVNITMGYPLDRTSIASLFTQFLELYLHYNEQGWFYKPMQILLSNPYVQLLFTDKETNWALLLQREITAKNWSYITTDKIQGVVNDIPNATALLFFTEQPSPKLVIDNCIGIILALKTIFTKTENKIALEYLYRFYTLFNSLKTTVGKNPFIADIKALTILYKELLSTEKLNFQGEPLEGLQIMGMLESRNLDFETVIITSVNEGILPSGKSNNSFIPFDVKKLFGLPTYKEKDAVYTYHFYRLLQRAKNVYIIYNTEPDVLEGREKSRLISQLLTDEHKSKEIIELIATPEIKPLIKRLKTIAKDETLMELIATRAALGFSPTSLANYIRNPLDFYKNTILRIEDLAEIEESVAANTFGTILHDTLEELYQPLLNSYLTETNLEALKPQILHTVKKHFGKSYPQGDISRGKNLIAFNVIVRYIQNFITLEIEAAKKHQIQILGLEEKLSVPLAISGISFPVMLKGKLDRIDTIDGMLRIIDYKTGNTQANQLELVDWDTLIRDANQNKAFQLLCYALMYSANHPVTTLQAGIISFKHLSAGLFNFATKEQKGARTKDTSITENTLALFTDKLYQLVAEICNPEVPFTEKEV